MMLIVMIANPLLLVLLRSRSRPAAGNALQAD
jgi:hypothetical protein